MTIKEENTLAKALEDALRVSAKARSTDYGLFFQLLVLRDDPDTASIELRNLLNVIQAIPSLEFFNHSYQCTFSCHKKIDFRFLIQWLISRGQQVGAEGTIKDLIRYLDSEDIEITEILAIEGFEVKENVKIGEYELVAWNSLEMTDTKYQIALRGFFGSLDPTAALIQRHEIKRIHIRPWSQSIPYIPHSIEPALDVLRCISTVICGGYRLLHYWFEPPTSTPWAVSQSRFGVDQSTLLHTIELKKDQILEISNCVTWFKELSEDQKLRLRIPLDRLNRSYMAGMRSVDKAIELGIALESLYAPTKLSEGIAFAVRSRAARFLGGSSEERDKTVKTLRDVYDLRSRAVHSGRFDADNNKKWRDCSKVSETLEEGQRLICRSLVKIIQESEPDWEKFDITDKS